MARCVYYLLGALNLEFIWRIRESIIEFQRKTKIIFRRGFRSQTIHVRVPATHSLPAPS